MAFLRHGASLLLGLLGGVGVLLLVVLMNRLDRSPKDPGDKKEVVFDVPEKRKQPPTRKPKRKPPPKKAPKKPPPPTPLLSQAVGGVDVGLWAGSQIDLGDGSDLLGDAGDAVMTADTVDSLPQRTSCPELQYPPQAQAREISGAVTVAMDFDASGRITNVKVVSSTDDIFEDTTLRLVRGCSFRPATYQGRAVPVNGIEWTINFDLEQGN